MESTQSVHGRITYRRVEAVIDEKIESLHYAETDLPFDNPARRSLQFAIETLRNLRDELDWRDATHYWPLPL